MDLIHLLDHHRVASEGYTQLKVDAAHECKCQNCPDTVIAEGPSVKLTEKVPV